MRSRLHLASLLLLVALAAPAVSQAQDDAQPAGLEDIREMVLYARYREAIEAVQAYLEGDDLSATERNEGLEVLATAQLAIRSPEAQATLRTLYSRDPRYRLSDAQASPTVQAAFQRAQEAAPEPVQPELLHVPPVLPARRGPALEVRLGQHADAVGEVRIAWRQAEEGRFSSVVANIDESGVARTRLPLADGDEAYTIEYYVEARAPSGAVLARQGSPSEPLTIDVPEAVALPAGGGGGGDVLAGGAAAGAGSGEEEDGGLLTEWWFWTVVGVVVAGGVAGGVVVATSSSSGDPPGSTLGTFRLQ